MDLLEKKILATPTAALWEKIGIKHHHGVALPLASCHSAKSCGIGEFLDLTLLIDWCASLGLDVIQLLPLNDSGEDPSPYNALSSCALHPIYIALTALPRWDQSSNLKHLVQFLQNLNLDERVPYSAVLRGKAAFFRQYLTAFGNEVLESDEFCHFVSHEPWLPFYALFKVLKEEFGGKCWEDWPDELRYPSKTKCKHLFAIYQKEMQLHMVLQFFAFNQLTYIKSYAEQKKVLLKGDIPILINRDSVDVWIDQSLFDLRYSAGYPPDYYTKEGQYWGFPLFRWDAMREENYAWWDQRLTYASHFYHLYRLDHISGFFHIWAIPCGQTPKQGSFIPPEDELIYMQGETILCTLLKYSKMLPIGEDLGVVPDKIKQILSQLGICGTKMVRWERFWNKGEAFIPFHQYNPLSMTTLSTHDSETLQLWWQNFPDEAKKFAHFKHWQYEPVLSQQQRLQILRDAHHSASLFHINLLQEYLALIPAFKHRNPQDERINIPGKILPENWTYRFLPPLEAIVANQELKEAFFEILK